MKEKTVQEAVDNNYAAFKKLLPELLNLHPGKFVIMRDEKVIQAFDSAGDARIFAEAQFPDGLYSIQQVTATVMDMGYFSHAVHHAEL